MSYQKVKVIVGLSGGVDSSVTALLLKKQGYEVEALFMKNWEEDDTESYCAASKDVADAQLICDQLKIPLHTVNFSTEYWEEVFTIFLKEYQAGRTPNPDILCNKEIKFKAFLNHALALGADYIATGHYAQKLEFNAEACLLKGSDPEKDQSYFLYTLGQQQLEKVLFPIGGLAKQEVRKIAKQENLATHSKKDSTGICFIGERRFKKFLSQYLPAKPGKMITADGLVLGEHQGLMYYTLGQRQGLGIGGQNTGNGQGWYVADKDLERNHLIVVQGEQHPLLYSAGLHCSQMSWVSGNKPIMPLNCKAKIRYRQKEVSCTLLQESEDVYRVNFLELQKAVTPGQSVVFYQEEKCLGGGIIDKRYA